jgi:lactoylglutathione lyase
MSDLFTLHHVSLYVRDVDASAFFDATVLGLAEIPNRVGESHIRWFIIDGFRTFHLIGGDPEPEWPRPFSTHVALATRDFEAALTRLEQNGVTYVSLARQPKDITIRADGVRQIYFQDPDGHWIEINDANAEPWALFSTSTPAVQVRPACTESEPHMVERYPSGQVNRRSEI